MIKVLIFVALVFALGFGFAFVADMPGEVAITMGDQLMTVSLMVAVIGIVSIVAAIMLTWWIVRVVFTSPQRMQRFFRARRRDRGYQSLSTGIVAAGAGDAAAARRMLEQAGGLLNETTEPLIQLLDAQATLLEGKHDDARAKFEAMLDDPELRMLGMRGLYMEAQRLGDRDAQRHYAERAAELAPQLTWAGRAAIDLKTATGDWDGAIRLIDKQKGASQISKDEAGRKRAVLLTALAMDNAEVDPARAKQSALEAHRLQPDFAPAAVTAAEAAFRLGEMRRGVKVLETAWRKTPHPEVALAYVNARPGDSALDRLKRAQRLESLKPNNTESALIIAQMALEAGEFQAARKAVAFILRNEPRESAFMLMADIEDAETGDQGKVREWLSRAVRAPRDPAWTADGYVAEKWAPFSPVTGRIDAFEWKVPVERIAAPTIENDLDPMVPGTPSDRGAPPEADDAQMVSLPPAVPATEPEPAPAAPAKPVRTIGAPADLAGRVETARREREKQNEITRAEATAKAAALTTAKPDPVAGDGEGDGDQDKVIEATPAETTPARETAGQPAKPEAAAVPADDARTEDAPPTSAARPANGKADDASGPEIAADAGAQAASKAPAPPAAGKPDGEAAKAATQEAETARREPAKPAAAKPASVKPDTQAAEQAPLVAPIPDDPGIDPDADDAEADKPRRFRLF